MLKEENFTQRFSTEGIAVIGMGAIGVGVTRLFAENGYKVFAVSRSKDEKFLSHLEREISKGRLSCGEADNILERIEFCSIDSLSSVPLVIEAVSEDVELKKHILSEVENSQTDETLLASSTSTIPIALLGKSLARPESFVGLHYNTPVHIMKLVEVIPSRFTSEIALKLAKVSCKIVDTIPAVVKDFPGFVASRLAQAMTNEAVRILQDGVADARTIDLIATKGLNMPIGPLRLLDEVGLDIAIDGSDSLSRMFENNRYAPAPLLRQMVYEGRCGRKTGEGFYKYGN